jgi:hypothetical protein
LRIDRRCHIAEETEELPAVHLCLNEIAHGKDAHRSTYGLEYDEASHLFEPHGFGGLLDIVVLLATDNSTAAHGIAYRVRLGVYTVGDSPGYHVPVGHNADEPSVRRKP